MSVEASTADIGSPERKAPAGRLRARTLGIALGVVILTSADGSNDTSAGLFILVALVVAAKRPWLGAALLAMGYLLLRLVHDFSEVPPLLIRAVEVGMAASIAAILFIPAPLPGLLVAAILAYLITVIAYDAWAFSSALRASARPFLASWSRGNSFRAARYLRTAS